MKKNKKIVCVIPARLKSTRFPQKVLCTLLDKPLLQWIWEAAINTKIFSETIFAVDSKQTSDLVKSFGARFLMTPESCKSGTERLVNVMKSGVINGDIWVNWQGDEPLINKKMIETLLQSCNSSEETFNVNDTDIWTLKKKIVNLDEINNPNFAKVVCDSNDHALFFSRSPIPYYRDDKIVSQQIYYKHVGIYAYTTNALEKISKIQNCYLENAEKLEQLSFLSNQLKIKVHETDMEVIGIDTKEDLQRAKEIITKCQL